MIENTNNQSIGWWKINRNFDIQETYACAKASCAIDGSLYNDDSKKKFILIARPDLANVGDEKIIDQWDKLYVTMVRLLGLGLIETKNSKKYWKSSNYAKIIFQNENEITFYYRHFFCSYQIPHIFMDKLLISKYEQNNLKIKPFIFLVKILFYLYKKHGISESYVSKKDILYFLQYQYFNLFDDKMIQEYAEQIKENRNFLYTYEEEPNKEVYNRFVKQMKYASFFNYYEDKIEILEEEIDNIQAWLFHVHYHYFETNVNEEVWYNNIFKYKTQKNMKVNNKIFFGCPGTGKSTFIEKLIDGITHQKVTFHPEYDYSSFIGVYKPFSDKNDKILYRFIPQIFIKIYIEAWKNIELPFALIIEEINRGNCASIFGDIFQLLDRDVEGFSQYFVNIDSDIVSYLEKELSNTNYAEHIKILYFKKYKILPSDPYSLLCLPNNLSILATMNTSDQSLFPMDSAFKRRWDWQYVPIDYADAEKQTIEVGTKKYSWALFLRKINAKIYAITESEDKQMGNRFVNSAEGTISIEVLINKVLFYLWFDVFRNENPRDKNYIFRKLDTQNLKYTDFFAETSGFNQVILEEFLAYNEISPL